MKPGKPLKVSSICMSQMKPQTFIVSPESHASSVARRVDCPCIATTRGTHATNASGQTSMPAKASQ